MISPEERWTTFLALTSSVVFFLGHLGMSQALSEFPEVRHEDSPPEVLKEYIDVLKGLIAADQQRLAREQKRYQTIWNTFMSKIRGLDRFEEAEKRVNSPHKYIPVVMKMSDVADHEPPSGDTYF